MKKILSLIFLFCALSCTKTEHDYFPNWPVNLELDLSFEDKELNGVMSYKAYIAGETPGLATMERTGLGGVLVYHSVDGFFAYDLACPKEMNSSVLLRMDKDAIYAVCPKCGSKFNVFEGYGSLVEGVADQGMKRYKVIPNGNKLYIRN